MQGFNMGRYVPPDLEGTISANKLAGKNALGARANKSSQGILTVRFEMPFPIWCTSCPKPTIIGQGVRFNAEKKKVGNYYSTPIWAFRMKHVVCGNWIEIRTDPKAADYVVHEGARKRDLGEGKEMEGDVRILTQEEREKLRADAFAHLEVTIEDRKRLQDSKLRIEELEDLAEQQWEDPYGKNRKLRRAFRAERKVREHDAAVTGALQDKMSLGIELLPASEEDTRRAGFVEFGAADPEKAIERAVAKPLFAGPQDKKAKALVTAKRSKKLKAADLVAQRKANLAQEISGRTRAATDPFLTDVKSSTSDASARIFSGIKRKRADSEETKPSTTANQAESVVDAAPAKETSATLVDYDSD